MAVAEKSGEPHRVFSAVKRKARGFRSMKNLITMRYFTADKLPLPVAP